MDVEVKVAVEFLISFLIGKLAQNDLNKFVECLIKCLTDRFRGHWYPEKPTKGSGYRCISVADDLDSVLHKAAKDCGVDESLLKSCLPKRIDLWIDPAEVSYRIGEYGSVMVIFKEGDDSVNSKSKFATAVLDKAKQNQKITKKDSKGQSKSKESTKNKENTKRVFSSSDTKPSRKSSIKDNKENEKVEKAQHSHSQGRQKQREVPNRLSPTAKSFVSRRSPPLLHGHHNVVSPNGIMYPPYANVDYLRKMFWPGTMYDPLAHAHNYLLAHELAVRYEAQMKAQRIAIQTHYLKSPYNYTSRRNNGHGHVSGSSNTTQNNSHSSQLQLMA